jgi:hypothetical protein
MKHRYVICLLLVCFAVCGCAAVGPSPVAPCPIAGQDKLVSVQLFFGLTKKPPPHEEFLTTAEWSAFEAEMLQPAFPDGFTVYEAHGYWLNPQTGVPSNEPTKVVLAVVAPTGKLGESVQRVIDGFRQRVPNQEVVGVLTNEVCARFTK